MTRIIAGQARGRRLAVPPAGTRPTSDRVRESLFSTLDSMLRADGLAWADVVVLDLYAGSGALGLEAASRGAQHVVLVERSRAAARVASANAETVGCPGVTVLVRDVARLADSPAPAAATLVLADPPYVLPSGALASAFRLLHRAGWVADDAVVVAERPARDDSEPFPDDWPVTAQRPYGDTVLWYGRSASTDDPRAEGT